MVTQPRLYSTIGDKMHVTAYNVIVWLAASHYLFDYPLQGDFLSKGKNHKQPLAGVPWRECLSAHCWLQAVGVYFVTGCFWLGVVEYVAHWWIDYSESEGWFGEGERAFNFDQSLHIMCKVLWALIWICVIKH
jgi:hypothetical protein